MIGKILGGYRIVEQIGMGGMATVYKAYDPGTDRYVALKTLPQQYSQDEQFRARFAREAKAIAKLEHIHILPVHAYGEDDDIAYMVMRLMETGTLSDIIRTRTLKLSECNHFLHQTAAALDYAHSNGVIHRDVKPSNVLVDRQNNAYLTDFGIAKMVEDTAFLTGTNNLMGTPQYMSPEQCRGEKDLTPATDQYSLGVMLFEMLTGVTPYHAETPMAIIRMQLLSEPIPLPTSLRPDLPKSIEPVLLKALTPEPNKRFATCSALAQAFAIAIEGAPDLLPPEGSTTQIVLEPSADATATIRETEEKEMPTVLKPTGDRTTLLESSSHQSNWLLRGAIAIVLTMVLIAVLGIAGVLDGDADEKSEQTGDQEVPAVNPTEADVASVPANIDMALNYPASILSLNPCYELEPDAPGICIRNAGGQVVERLLPDFALKIPSLSWSPDGQQIAFDAYSTEMFDTPRSADIYIVTRDGSELHQLTTDGKNLEPAWSPDGEWIALHQDCNLALIKPEGSPLQTLYSDIFGCVANPVWSPDSQWLASIVHFSGQDSSGEQRAVVLFSVEDGSSTTLATVPFIDINDECPIMDVMFSPDGQYIAYSDNECQVRLINVNDPSQSQIVDVYPAWWLPTTYPFWGGYLNYEVDNASTAGGTTDTSDDNQILLDILDETIVLPDSEVFATAFSPDGSLLAVGGHIASNPYSVAIVDTATHEIVHIPEEPNARVDALTWSPDGRYLAAGEADREVFVWDTTTWELVWGGAEHNDEIHALTFSPDGRQMASGGYDDQLLIWDTQSWQFDIIRSPHGDNSLSVSYSPDGTRLASGGDNRTINIWDIPNKELLATLQGHTGAVQSIVWTPDGNFIVSSSEDGTIRVWEVAIGAEVAQVLATNDHVMDIAWSPDQQYLVAVGFEGIVWVYAYTGEGRFSELDQLQIPRHTLHGVTWSPDGRTIVVGYIEDGSVVWLEFGADAISNENTALLLTEQPVDKDMIFGAFALAFAPNDSQIAIAGIGELDHAMMIMDTRTQNITVLDGAADSDVNTVAWSANGQFVAAGYHNSELYVWETASWSPVLISDQHNHAIHALSFSPDSQYLLTSDHAGQIIIWNTANWEISGYLGTVGVRDEITSLVFSPDGTLVASGDNTPTIQVWDLATAEQIMVIETPHELPIQTVAWTPDGRYLLSGSQDGRVHLWDVPGGRSVGTILETSQFIMDMAWAPDQNKLAIVGYDGHLRIFTYARDANEFSLLLDLETANPLHSVAWSHDGQHLLAGDITGSMSWWTLAD